MNDSGRALQRPGAFYKAAVSDIAVVYDDLTIGSAPVKVSVTGSAGGHNGVASLLEHLGNGFVRYRLGIGPETSRPRKWTSRTSCSEASPIEHRTLFEQKLDLLSSTASACSSGRSGPAEAMNHPQSQSPK
jgi:PTH1 family peptidyl-tRNA hydrolase